MRLEEERFAFEQCLAEQNDARTLRQQDHDTKRLSLDKRCIELEVKRAGMDNQERRNTREERKGMLAVLDALVKKLQ